jgi:transposase
MLDTIDIEKTYDLDSEQGRNPIHPKTFIKVGLFALYNCRFSLRKMQEDIENHLGYKWLTGDKAIDHSTMGKFYAKYLDEIVELFSQVVTICKKQDLIDFDILAIDSMKLRANASHKQSKSLESIEKEVEKIKKRVRELIEAATEDGTIHQEEERALAARMARLKEAKSVLKQRIEEKAEGEDPKEKRKLQKKEKINVTDFDAHIMQQANREQNPAYSITTATDTAADVITHFQVNARNDDEAALMDAIKGSRKATGQKHEVVDADSGFASRDNYERLEKEGQEALIPDHRLEAEQRGETSRGQYDRSKFIYDERIDTYICPCGARLSKMAELTIQGIQYHRYANASACKECDFRDKCTPGKYRSIYRDRKEEFQERMRGKLKVEENQAKYNKRAHASESPYGNLKRNLKFTYVMRRGIEKVRMEMAMLFMLHNILKAAPVLMEGGP